MEIYDLFAGYGKCVCEENGESWDGSAIISAKGLQKYSRPKRLWLNCYNDDPEEMKTQCSSLKECLDAVKGSFRIDLFQEPVLVNIDKAIASCDPKYPSIWILDPYSPAQLPWGVVERIATHQGNYEMSEKQMTRRPELFINLQTAYLARFSGMEDSKHIVDEALGMPREVWEGQLAECLKKDTDTQSAFVEIYGNRLMEIYGKHPIAWKVKGTSGNIVYTILLITESDAGYYVMQVMGKSDVMDWFVHNWKPIADVMKAQRSEKRKAEKSNTKATFLTDFE